MTAGMYNPEGIAYYNNNPLSKIGNKLCVYRIVGKKLIRKNAMRILHFFGNLRALPYQVGSSLLIV